MTTHNKGDVKHSSAVKDLQSKVDESKISKEEQKLAQSKPDVLEKGKVRPPYVGHLHHLQNMAESIEGSTVSEVDRQAGNGSNPNDAITDRIQDSLKSLD